MATRPARAGARARAGAPAAAAAAPSAAAPLLAAALLAGCAGYEAAVQPVRDSLRRGDLESALAAVNKRLKVDSAAQVPGAFEEETALLLLERAMILQWMGRYPEASRDMQEAEKHLELLDLTKDTVGDIGKYLYSDDVTVYKAPAYEKLLLSTMNLINYLARGDLSGARVEARRLTVTRNYLRDVAGEAGARFGLGSYLGGFAFEKSGRPDEALRHYDDALSAGPYPSLDAAVSRLAAAGSYRTPRLDAALQRAGEIAPLAQDEGEILVLLQAGLAPRKLPERFPVGLFFALAYDVTHPRYAMTPAQRRNADIVMAQGLLKWVNFPVLEKVRRDVRPAAVYVADRTVAPDPALDVDARVRDAYEATKGPLIVAAVTRLVTRALAGIGTRKVVKEASGNAGLGLLAGLVAEGLLTAKDTPDTRSWTSLPSEVAVARLRVPAGAHAVVGEFSTPHGRVRQQARVSVPPGGFALVNFALPR